MSDFIEKENVKKTLELIEEWIEKLRQEENAVIKTELKNKGEEGIAE